jgi:NAD(P)-dependent dehydrogenase (short-subunit alcohol dehydrogenase family)
MHRMPWPPAAAATSKQGGHSPPAVLDGLLPPRRPRVSTRKVNLEAAYRWLAGQVPLGRIGVADEVARWITFLLCPLSSFLTGAVIPLDGGQVIHRV